MSCFALLCVRFDDSQESRFQASKRSNMGSAVLEVGRLLIFTNSVFKEQNVQIWTVSMCKGFNLVIVRNGNFRSRDVRIIAVQSCKVVDLLVLVNGSFRVRNVEICTVMASIEVDC